jgi:hypothetical protein
MFLAPAMVNGAILQAAVGTTRIATNIQFGAGVIAGRRRTRGGPARAAGMTMQ